MRLLPTIYACNQLIMHHGILVNNQIIMKISHRVNLGDIVTASHTYWFLFYDYLFDRIDSRLFGHSLLEWRRIFFLKKIRFYRLKKKYVYMKNFKLLYRFKNLKIRVLFLKKLVKSKQRWRKQYKKK